MNSSRKQVFSKTSPHNAQNPNISFEGSLALRLISADLHGPSEVENSMTQLNESPSLRGSVNFKQKTSQTYIPQAQPMVISSPGSNSSLNASLRAGRLRTLG